MTLLNREIAPPFAVVEKVEMIKAGIQHLKNKIPVYTVNGGTQDIVKVEFLFDAGIFKQIIPLQAITVNALLEEGTSKFSAAQIADMIDFYGAFLETNIGQDNSSVVLYTLNKHLKSVLPVIEQIIKDAVFPQNELDIHLKNKKQQFHVNNQKVANVARKHFSELIFGEKHPYGINVKESDFENINRNYLNEFYNQFYSSESCKIILSGKVNDSIFPLLDNHFGGNDWSENLTNLSAADKQKYLKNNTVPVSTSVQREHIIVKENAMQSAIRIGKVMFNKTHADFQYLQILNTIFGGYFGSRLMSNIREDKGYTYGIGSGIISLKHSGYFFISTEVGVEVCQNAIDEIYFEMQRLREELVSEQELSLVKNYLLGSFLRGIDGPFAMADRFKGIMEYGLGYDYYDNYIATIRTASASKLRDLANQYFDKQSMTELVVGKK
jgi:predicted Zn-dependent peptidase